MDKVRIGVVGSGNIGRHHIRYLAGGEIPGAVLAAVCDTDLDRLQWVRENVGEGVGLFDDAGALYSSGLVDGVLISTPHYEHPPLAVKAFEHGLHVLVEKPAGVHAGQVREMNEAAVRSGKVFGIMFNQRTNPIYQKVRDLVSSGELGALKRIIWIITSWYRPQSYYDSGGWRATWRGEGGGVLTNQAPHNLDLWQWICGLPSRVRAFCHFGKWHQIEVEDDVTAYMEYANGATGILITATADTPGTNRLELSGDRGKIVVEEGKLTFWRLRVPEREFNREYKGGFGEPECWRCEVPIGGTQTAHQGITANWTEAILKGVPMIAPGLEGLDSVALANAMHLSTWTDSWVDLPVDEDLYRSELDKRTSLSEKKGGMDRAVDVNGTC